MKRVFGKKVYFILHDLYPDMAEALGIIKTNSFLTKVMRWTNRISLKRMEKIVVLGRRMKNYLVKRYSVDDAKIVAIHNCAVPENVTPMQKDNQWAKEHGLDTKFVILYSGNIGRFQDFDTVLATAKKLQSEKDIVFLFVGEGAEKENLERRVREDAISNVMFLPYVSTDQHPYALATGDLHMIPLKSDMEDFSFPGKIYSSMAAGRPVLAICEENGDLSSLVKEHNIGLWCRDVDECIKAVLELKNKPDLRAECGKNALKLAATVFSRETIAGQYYALLQ